MPGRSVANEPHPPSIILEQGNQKEECAEGRGCLPGSVKSLYLLDSNTEPSKGCNLCYSNPVSSVEQKCDRNTMLRTPNGGKLCLFLAISPSCV